MNNDDKELTYLADLPVDFRPKTAGPTRNGLDRVHSPHKMTNKRPHYDDQHHSNDGFDFIIQPEDSTSPYQLSSSSPPLPLDRFDHPVHSQNRPQSAHPRLQTRFQGQEPVEESAARNVSTWSEKKRQFLSFWHSIKVKQKVEMMSAITERQQGKRVRRNDNDFHATKPNFHGTKPNFPATDSSELLTMEPKEVVDIIVPTPVAPILRESKTRTEGNSQNNRNRNFRNENSTPRRHLRNENSTKLSKKTTIKSRALSFKQISMIRGREQQRSAIPQRPKTASMIYRKSSRNSPRTEFANLETSTYNRGERKNRGFVGGGYRMAKSYTNEMNKRNEIRNRKEIRNRRKQQRPMSSPSQHRSHRPMSSPSNSRTFQPSHSRVQQSQSRVPHRPKFFRLNQSSKSSPRERKYYQKNNERITYHRSPRSSTHERSRSPRSPRCTFSSTFSKVVDTSKATKQQPIHLYGSPFLFL